MTYAQRIAAAHGRIRSKFGTDASGAQLYVWHNNVQIHAYQPSGKNGRNLMAQIIVKDDTVSVIATKAQFATVPKINDEIKMGTVLATAVIYRIYSVTTTHIRPFYDLELIDPNMEATAA